MKIFGNLGYATPFLNYRPVAILFFDEIVLSCSQSVFLIYLYFEMLMLQDGVMVVSSCLRYRDKYVTTLLYRPVSLP